MKRIGIDGSALIKDCPTGVEVMSRELITALIKQDRDNQYFVYAPKPLPEEILRFPNVTGRVGKIVRFWTQTLLPRMIKRDNLDVFWSPSNILPRAVKCKTLATIHDLAFMRFPRCYRIKDWFLSWLTAYRAVKYATSIMTVSRQTKQDLVHYFDASLDQIKVIYCALPYTHQQANPQDIKHKYNLPDTFLLSVGRIEPRKNPTNIILAFKMIAPEFPDLHLVFVGPPTSYLRKVQSLIDRSGLHSRVHLLGFVPLDDLFTIYQMAQVLVFPSLYEGFGIPILESWAARTPVVTSNVGATKEVAEDAAALVDPSSPRDIAEKIKNLLKDETIRAKYIQAGTSRLQHFSWKHSAGRLKDILENL